MTDSIDREELAEFYKWKSGKTIHASDCATSCAPAMVPGPCDCDVQGDVIERGGFGPRTPLRWPAAPASTLTDERDAARYRQWRKGEPLMLKFPHPFKPDKFVTVSYGPNPEPGYGEALDAALDAARIVAQSSEAQSRDGSPASKVTRPDEKNICAALGGICEWPSRCQENIGCCYLCLSDGSVSSIGLGAEGEQ